MASRTVVILCVISLMYTAIPTLAVPIHDAAAVAGIDAVSTQGETYGLGDYINVKNPEYGAFGDGVTDDTAAITAANTAAHAALKPLYFPPGVYKVTGSFELDVTKSCWVAAPGVQISALTYPVSSGSVINDDISVKSWPYLLWIYSSAPYATSYKRTKVAVSNIQFVGGAQRSSLDMSCLKIGHNTYVGNSEFAIEHCAIFGFNTGIEFTKNAWKVYLNHLDIRWARKSTILAPTNLTNFGENMVVRDCFIADSEDVSIGKGEWHFYGCSFDNTPLRLTGDTKVFLHGCHFENPGSTTQNRRYIALENSEALCQMHGCHLVLNKPSSGNQESALIEVVDANTEKGLYISGLSAFMASYYTPEVNDGHRLLVAGGGRVQMSGFQSWNNNTSFYLIAKSLNLLCNGDMELDGNSHGVSDGWTKTGAAKVSLDGTTFKEGSNSLKISCKAGETASVSQSFPVVIGQWITYGLWRKAAIVGGGTLNVSLRFYTQDGTEIGNGYQSTNLTSNTDWTDKNSLICKGMRVPVGAATGKLILTCTSNDGVGYKTDGWFDFAIVNSV